MHTSKSLKEPLWTRQFITISTINILLFFGFQLLTPTLPVYVKGLGGTDQLVGWVNGIFTVSALLIRPLIGITLDRVGRRGIFLWGLSLFVLISATYSWLPTIGWILFFRFLHGFGWGAASTASNTIASDLVPKSRFGEGMGYFTLASSLALAISPAVGLALNDSYGFAAVSWLAAGLVLLGLLLAFAVRYRKIERPAPASRRAALFEKTSARAAIVIFFVTMTYGAINSFLALYAKTRGIENVGPFFTVFAGSMLIFRPLFGLLLDRFGVSVTVVPGLVAIAAAMVVLSLATTLPVFIMAAAIFGLGFGAAQPSLQSMAVMNAPRERFGAANSTFYVGFDSGIGVGSVVFGSVSSVIGYSRMFLWSTVTVLIAFILFFAVGNRHAGQRRETE